MGTVLDCLDLLNLTDFATLIEGTSLESTLNMTDTSFTVFALTNEAIANASAFFSGLSQDELESLLSSYIVEKTIPDSKLLHGAVFTPLMEETLLHVTDVYEYSGWGYFQWKSSEVGYSVTIILYSENLVELEVIGDLKKDRLFFSLHVHAHVSLQH